MIKDVMVHVDATSHDEARLSYAAHLASSFEAHLTALFINSLPGVAFTGDPVGGGGFVLAELIERSRAEGDRLEEAIRANTARLAAPVDLRRLDVLPEEVGYTAAAAARGADVFVALLPERGGRLSARWISMIEGVLFGSGRGMLLVPNEIIDNRKLGQVVVGWNNSRESTRAVAEAMPLLEKADQVVVVTVSAPSAAPNEEPARDFARHLGRHGLKVTLRHVRSRDASDALLGEATALHADLLVLGGYGHSRLREWILGGVTRDLLERSTIPLFLAH